MNTPPAMTATRKSDGGGVLAAILGAPKWPLMIGGFFVLAGLLVLFSGTTDPSLVRKLLGALLSELGFAFFIAFVLHASLEFHARVEHDRQLSEGIISYIYGVRLDDQMFAAVESHVFRSKFYRTEMSVEYEFLAKRGDKFLLRYTLSYVVKNISTERQTYNAHTFVEKPAGEKINEELFGVELGLQHLRVDGSLLTGKDLEEAKQDRDKTDDFIESNHEISLGSGDHKRVEICHLLVKFERDVELWRSMVPSSGLTLRLRWKSDFNLSFKAVPVHPADKFDFIRQTEDTVIAELFRPFFPHNGVQFWWGPEGSL